MLSAEAQQERRDIRKALKTLIPALQPHIVEAARNGQFGGTSWQYRGRRLYWVGDAYWRKHRKTLDVAIAIDSISGRLYRVTLGEEKVVIRRIRLFTTDLGNLHAIFGVFSDQIIRMYTTS